MGDGLSCYLQKSGKMSVKVLDVGGFLQMSITTIIYLGSLVLLVLAVSNAAVSVLIQAHPSGSNAVEMPHVCHCCWRPFRWRETPTVHRHPIVTLPRRLFEGCSMLHCFFIESGQGPVNAFSGYLSSRLRLLVKVRRQQGCAWPV